MLKLSNVHHYFPGKQKWMNMNQVQQNLGTLSLLVSQIRYPKTLAHHLHQRVAIGD